MSSIFGKSAKGSSASLSENRAFDDIKAATSGSLGRIGQAGDLLAAFLGGDTSGFDTYKKNTGFDFLSEQGSRGITGNAAARGMLRSGGTSKALVNYGSNLQQTFSDNYLSKILGLGNFGLSAGQLLTGAGQRTESARTEEGGKSGLGGLLGSIGASVALSDPRTKENVVKVGAIATMPGMNLYEFNYKGSKTRYVGVMADEVEEVFPEALGPTTKDGFKTVNYRKLPVELERIG